MTAGNVLARIYGRYQRTSSRLLFRRPLTMQNGDPIISFTFDDFPRSALSTGGPILGRFGVTGTYYASFGLMGKQTPTGSMFVAEDLRQLFEQGHELGCHTFAHCDSWDTEASVFEASIVDNQCALRALMPDARFRTIAYPITP